MGAVMMGRRLQIAFFAIALCSAVGGKAFSESTHFSCSGDDIEPVGLAKSPNYGAAFIPFAEGNFA
jgi:hypothetical protein